MTEAQYYDIYGSYDGWTTLYEEVECDCCNHKKPIVVKDTDGIKHIIYIDADYDSSCLVSHSDNRVNDW
jgi:hypothetical protein